MEIDKELLKDIIIWDTSNWSKALSYWQNNFNIENKNYSCLELGANQGGLSLWMALQGNNVICSDYYSPEEKANKLHKKYKVENRITYEAIDATNIPYENKFDVVVFKSILGGISRKENNKLKKETLDQIHKSLKDGGYLFFAENLEGSFLHSFLRKNFVSWAKEWNYLKLNEIDNVFSSYKEVSYMTLGFFGTFGLNEKQREILGDFDSVINNLIPEKQRYIIIGIAKK
jgi:SAM-dependent methyltransferase